MAEEKLRLPDGHQLIYKAKLRKLIDKKGNLISLPKFRTFYIVKDVARATTWLVHLSSNGEVKWVKIGPACHLEVATATNSSGGPVFMLRAPPVVDQLYEAEGRMSYEKWCCSLRILIEAKARLIAIDIPSKSSIPYQGPALMVVQESCVMIKQPSSLQLLHSFPVLVMTSFGADKTMEWIALCRACAKTRGSPEVFSFSPPSIASQREFLDELKRHGEMMTSGLWMMSDSTPDHERYMVDHAKVCRAGNVWNITFRREFVDNVLVPLFADHWQELAVKLNFSVADIVMFKQSPNPVNSMFESWNRKSSAYESEPKELLRAARSVGLDYEANTLLHHMLREATTYEEAHLPTGPACASPPLVPPHANSAGGLGELSPTSASTPPPQPPPPSHSSPSASPGRSPVLMRNRPSSMAILSSPVSPRQGMYSERGTRPLSSTASSVSPMLGIGNPLSERNLYRLATKITKGYPNKWKHFAYELSLPSPTIQAIARSTEDVVERVFQCLQAWKTLPTGALPGQLVEGLKQAEMQDLAAVLQEEIRNNPLHYAEKEIVPASLELPQHHPSPKERRSKIISHESKDDPPPMKDDSYVTFLATS